MSEAESPWFVYLTDNGDVDDDGGGNGDGYDGCGYDGDGDEKDAEANINILIYQALLYYNLQLGPDPGISVGFNEENG